MGCAGHRCCASGGAAGGTHGRAAGPGSAVHPARAGVRATGSAETPDALGVASARGVVLLGAGAQHAKDDDAAKHVTEAQFQDAVRSQVDNLYTLLVGDFQGLITVAPNVPLSDASTAPAMSDATSEPD